MSSAANVGPIPESGTVGYVFDPESSKFIVHVTAGGWMSAFGHNPEIAIRKFAGTVVLDPDTIERSSITLRIEATSLGVISEVSAKDRRDIEHKMQSEVLNSDGFPEILYECSEVTASASGEGSYWAALNGKLILRGVTRNQIVSASVKLTDAGLHATGNFSIRQTHFGIKPVSVLGGGLVVKDELKFDFDIVARKTQTEQP